MRAGPDRAIFNPAAIQLPVRPACRLAAIGNVASVKDLSVTFGDLVMLLSDQQTNRGKALPIGFRRTEPMMSTEEIRLVKQKDLLQARTER